MAKKNQAVDAKSIETPSETDAALSESPEPAIALVRRVVRARIHFSDALTGVNFRVGDVVNGWNNERVAEYEKRGLVIISRETGPSELKHA